MSTPDLLSELDLTPWPGIDRWRVEGGTGRWTATRDYAGAEVEVACPTLNGLIAACRDFDGRVGDIEAHGTEDEAMAAALGIAPEGAP